MPALPSLKKAPVIKHGPRLYALQQEPEHLGPPGEPPPGFVTPKTSATEWPPYWGLARIFGTPKADMLRRGPFIGGPPIWTYQAYVDANAGKSANIDFVVWNPYPRGTPIAIRIQTEFFHNFASNDTQVFDILHKERLSRGFAVVDIYDFDYMRDGTGAAIIVLLKDALGMIERPSAIRTGRVQRV